LVSSFKLSELLTPKTVLQFTRFMIVESSFTTIRRTVIITIFPVLGEVVASKGVTCVALTGKLGSSWPPRPRKESPLLLLLSLKVLCQLLFE